VSTYTAPGAEEGRCGAQLRGQPGVFCRKFAAKGRTRCRLHGGASLTGRDHPSWLHGRRSAYVIRRSEYERWWIDFAGASALHRRAIASGASGWAEFREVRRCMDAF
jgi:hypothetical protein